MTAVETSIEKLKGFVGGSPSALAQLLVAAAGKSTFARIVDCPTYPAAARTPDLPEALACLRLLLGSSDGYRAVGLARLYNASRSITQRKRTGQFFTPPVVAEWGLTLGSLDRDSVVCDAGAGTGIIAEALLKSGRPASAYIGVETDPILALCAAHVLEANGAPASFKVWYANFLTLARTEFEERGLPAPNVVISNPPFIRSHRLQDRSRTLASLGASLGVKLSSMSGAWNYFLCKAAELLQFQDRHEQKKGRLLFFSPREATGAAYSRRLREDLHRKVGWQPTQHDIPENLLNGQDFRASSLALLFVFQRGVVPARQSSARTATGHVVGDLLTVRRGISTGRNAFFVLSQEDVQEREIPTEYLSPVLPTRISLTADTVSHADWYKLLESGHACWLLTLPNVEIDQLERPVRTYLSEGVRAGLHDTATARRSKTWYCLPIPPSPADVFITYLFRGAPRFILNEARLHHLTNILGGRFRNPLTKNGGKAAIVSALNAMADEWFKNGAPGREYRDGLRKIEPKEFERLPIGPSTARQLGLLIYQGEHGEP